MDKKLLNTLGIALLFILLALVIVKYYFDKYNLEKEHRFTIGTTYSYSTSKSGYVLHFNFSIKGILFESDQIVYNKPARYLHRHYYVMFSPHNPKNCELLLEQPVMDSTLIPPVSGWDEIP